MVKTGGYFGSGWAPLSQVRRLGATAAKKCVRQGLDEDGGSVIIGSLSSGTFAVGRSQAENRQTLFVAYLLMGLPL